MIGLITIFGQIPENINKSLIKIGGPLPFISTQKALTDLQIKSIDKYCRKFCPNIEIEQSSNHIFS